MKTNQFDSIRHPKVRIDKSLDKYKGVILFPEKLEKAKALIAKAGLPGMKKVG